MNITEAQWRGCTVYYAIKFERYIETKKMKLEKAVKLIQEEVNKDPKLFEASTDEIDMIQGVLVRSLMHVYRDVQRQERAKK